MVDAPAGTGGTDGPAGPTPILVLVAGKDPLDEPGAGHSGYVVAHARAATAAGWAPQILCVGATDRVTETEFGTIRRYRTPYRPIRQLMIPGHARVLRRGLLDLVRTLDGSDGRVAPSPVLVHAFGVWGAGAVDAVRDLRAEGRTAVLALSSYTTYRVEHDSLVRGAVDASWSVRVKYWLQAAWVAVVVERWERRAYRSADRVWANYESVRTIIGERHGEDVTVDLIPYGPESAFFPAPNAAPDPSGGRDVAGDPVRVVCVSRHHSRKGVDVLIRALAVLAQRGVAVDAVLVGEGPLLDEHRALVSRLGLAEHVSLPGRVEAVDDHLLGADLYVLPSREEQSGALALLEAQRLGVAVVASAVDGIPEDVTDGETGLLVAPGDPGALADAIERLVVDPGLRRSLAAAGRARFEERFAAGPFVAGLAAAYADLGFRR